MSAETRTVEHVEAAVETVEIEEAQCPVCQQWYAEEEQLVPIAVGAQYDRDVELVTADQLTQVCTGCAEGLFDYEQVPDGRLEGVRREIRWWTPEDITKTVRGLLRAVLPIAITGGILWAAIRIMNDVVTASSAEFASAADSVSGVAPLLNFIPIVMVLLIMVAVIRMMALGPRGM
jgi:hypothetical protein